MGLVIGKYCMLTLDSMTTTTSALAVKDCAYATKLFHDARENMLEQQVWGPLLAQNEMGNPSVGYVIDKIKALSDYQDLFAQSFNSQRSKGESADTRLR
jgi:cytochrome c peroxidase